MKTQLAAVIILGSIIVGCASDSPAPLASESAGPAGLDGAFRGRWWSYYERGTAYLGAEQLAQAEQDFRKALEGRSTDSWRARTYGLHFVEFFPNRELGIALFKQGNVEAAEEFLRTSLEQVDTDRAHYYLDLVKREKIARGIISDDAEPGLSTSLGGRSYITERVIDLEVDAQDDQGVYNLEINGKPIHLRGSKQAVAYQEKLVLEEGPQQIAVAATDLADKGISETVSVTVDLTGPTIGIMEPREATVTQADSVTLRGAAVDKNGITELLLGEEVLYNGDPSQRQEFERQMPLASGDNTFVIIARDVAGNETRSSISIYRGAAGEAQAKLWRLNKLAPEGVQLAAATDAISLDMLLAAAAEGAGGITIKYPAMDRPYRHNRTVRVIGDVVSAAAVSTITINGEAVEPIAGAPKETFNKFLPIDVPESGTATLDVAVQAQDSAGAAYEKTVQVTVEPIVLNSPETKLHVAPLGFDNPNLDANLQTLVGDQFRSAVFEQGRFEVVEREEIQRILTELQLSAEGLTDPNNSVRVGEAVNANLFAIGTIAEQGDTGLEIRARVIDVETTRVTAELDVFVDDKNDRTKVFSGCEALANQLREAFPRLTGEVVFVKPDKTMIFNWTEEDGAKVGMDCILLQVTPAVEDPVTGFVAEGSMDPIGRGEITKVLPENAEVKAIDQSLEGATIDRGTPAVTL